VAWFTNQLLVGVEKQGLVAHSDLEITLVTYSFCYLQHSDRITSSSVSQSGWHGDLRPCIMCVVNIRAPWRQVRRSACSATSRWKRPDTSLWNFPTPIEWTSAK